MTAGYRMFLDEGTASYRQLMEVVLDKSGQPALSVRQLTPPFPEGGIKATGQ